MAVIMRQIEKDKIIEILNYSKEGYSRNEMADKLKVSTATIFKYQKLFGIT